METKPAIIPPGGYRVIYADPPWAYITWSNKNQTRAASNHYETMSLDDIKALPVSDYAARDCVLFIWALNSMIPQALDVISAWGFTYKTVGFTWGKKSRSGHKWHFGMGKWTRQNSETCFLATRGKPKRLSAAVRELVLEPVREHSRKPDRIRTDIQALCDGPYLEMFARSRAPGWDVWGNQTDKFEVQA